jgi:L-iditol 2-dehydrogenase
MRALQFNVTPFGFVKSRALSPVLGDAVRFGVLSSLRLLDLPEPELPGDHWVHLDLLACGICGTDLSTLGFDASPALEPFGSFPAVPGHEILARVRAVGPAVTRVEPGMRVTVDPFLSCGVRGVGEPNRCPSCAEGWTATCELAGEEGPLVLPGGTPLSPGLTMGYHRDLPGGWGERMVAHESALFPVDDALHDYTAVLTEPLSIGLHAVLNTPLAGDPDVVVLGSGPIAMGVIWALRATGFTGSITAQVKRAHEAELAATLGATNTVKPGLEAREALIATGARAYQPILGDEVFSGGGFPVVFDCVGRAETLAQSLRWAAPRGRIIVLGCAAELRKLDLTFLWAREVSLQGFVGYGMEQFRGERRHTFEVAHTLLLETEAPLRSLVTHVFPLSQYRTALSAASNHRRSGAMKVVLTPG